MLSTSELGRLRGEHHFDGAHELGAQRTQRLQDPLRLVLPEAEPDAGEARLRLQRRERGPDLTGDLDDVRFRVLEDLELAGVPEDDFEPVGDRTIPGYVPSPPKGRAQALGRAERMRE
jgi:hypothetical protein